MSTDAVIVTGLFETREQTLAAVAKVREEGWQVKEIHSPIPDTALSEILGRKKSRVGWFTMAGGIIGFFSGFSLAVFTATRWNLIVGGKPIVSWVAFFIVAFEFTILFAVFGNVLGLLTQVGLPEKNWEENHSPECSGSMYGIKVAAAPEEVDRLNALLHRQGATGKR